MKIRRLADLTRDELARLGREYMLFGHLYDRALMPQVAIRLGGGEIEPLSISEWKGASPNYTRRMKRLMRIDGDDVVAIVKALQLDVGFPHEYMDVRFQVHEDGHAEFWLNHCGALMDVEPRGEKGVVMMCHRIEDPTFDATAVATNPRARMRPIHRPPRTPADRHPHCHWTIRIEPDADPLVEEPLTREVGELPVARLPNERPPDREAGGWSDYAGPFDPEFRLERLGHGTLVAVLREFALQAQLLASAADLFLARRHDRSKVREVLANQWQGASWVAAERIAAELGVRGGVEGVAQLIALHPALPPGVDVALEPVGERGLRVAFDAPPALLDPEAPGWLGLLASGEAGALEAIARAVEPRARVDALGPHAFRVDLDASREPAETPQSVALTRLSTAASWRFHRFGSR
jgi:hypothetical protein